MSEPSKREQIVKEVIRLNKLASELQSSINRLEAIYLESESTDDEGVPDPFELQDGTIHKGTVVVIKRRRRQPLSLEKYAEVLEVTSPIRTLVQSQYSKPVCIANTEFEIATTKQAFRYLESCAES